MTKHSELIERLENMREGITREFGEPFNMRVMAWRDAINTAIQALSPVQSEEVEKIVERLRDYVLSMENAHPNVSFSDTDSALAAGLIERLAQTSAYWKAEHLAGNKRIDELEAQLSYQEEENTSLLIQIEQLEAQIKGLKDSLEEAITGISWYRMTHPESDSPADDEFIERATAAMTEKTDESK